METNATTTAPKLMYYATIYFPDGTCETPTFFVFENMADGFRAIRRYYEKEELPIESIEMKELEYIGSCAIPDDAYIMVPANDYGYVEDFIDVERHQKMIEEAESTDNESLMLVFPDQQIDDEIDTRSFYMGPYIPATDTDSAIEAMIKDPFTTSLPVDIAWFYKPTGFIKEA